MIDNKKTKAQYMTPDNIVTMILDNIDYSGENVLSKKIMEPSFGDGAFLINIVRRIISEGKNNGFSENEIVEIINHSVFGIEKDVVMYQRAIDRLNGLLDDYGIKSINWTDNLICGDTLILYKNFIGSMDYVVGNPPYVRIHNIPEDYRDAVKEFRFVDGIIDLYVVFYEIGIMMLNETGKLGYISPNSFMKNSSQRKFRNFLLENKFISAIYNFRTSKIFKKADTYTCICILDKNINRADFSVDYKEFSKNQLLVENRFEFDYFKTQLKDKAWNLGSSENIRFFEQNKGLPIKISDMAIVQNGIATNKDSVYIVHVYKDKKLQKPYYGKHSDKKKTVFFKDKSGIIRPIESTILHRCVKASRYNGIMDNTYIVFPYEEKTISKYYTQEGAEVPSGYNPLNEIKLKQSFPLAYEYLSIAWNELINRDMDKKISWFLFGRSQGLRNSCFKKIVFKHYISKDHPRVEPHILDNDVIVYSGMYTTIDINNIKSRNLKTAEDEKTDKFISFDESLYEYALKNVYNIYASDEFGKYCSITGKDMSGGYVKISSQMVKKFGTRLDTLSSFSGYYSS